MKSEFQRERKQEIAGAKTQVINTHECVRVRPTGKAKKNLRTQDFKWPLNASPLSWIARVSQLRQHPLLLSIECFLLPDIVTFQLFVSPEYQPFNLHDAKEDGNYIQDPRHHQACLRGVAKNRIEESRSIPSGSGSWWRWMRSVAICTLEALSFLTIGWNHSRASWYCSLSWHLCCTPLSLVSRLGEKHVSDFGQLYNATSKVAWSPVSSAKICSPIWILGMRT